MTDDHSDQRDAQWFQSAEIDELSLQILRVDLALPDLEKLADYVAQKVSGEEIDHRVELFGDALSDLSRLLEEYAFEAAVAATYLQTTQAKRHSVRAERTSGLKAVPLSSTIRALLSPYLAPLPMPSALLSDPNADVPGFRVLGGWWAAQLIDSAFLRGLAALDRIASMLYLASEHEVDEDRMPAFRAPELRRLNDHYGGESWTSMRALLQDPIFEFVKSYRDGFVHRHRLPMELHGDHTALGPGGEVYRGIEPKDHFSLVLAFHERVLKQACELAGTLVISPTSSATPTE